MEIKSKKTLLERYGVPIHHLDFKYISECKNGREMEKIFNILISNEEGYFPDLTKCAEDKLRELKPESRLFRIEEQIRGREALAENELKPIYDWNQDIKNTDKKLQNLVRENKSVAQAELEMPAIRKNGKIQFEKTDQEKSTNTCQNSADNKQSKRIKSTDYTKWDKYDPDEEILRMDLAEERVTEELEYKNRLNSDKYTKEPLTITEIVEENEKECSKLHNLSEIEKEKLSEEFRLRGNEYYRAKEYDNALSEYTKSIQTYPQNPVHAYNNRALTYFRLQRFTESVEDSQACLKLEPQNLKARLRLAEAIYASGKRRESYQLYINVLELDPQNSVALKATMELRKIFEDLPPPNATRLQIQEESSKNKVLLPKKDGKSSQKMNEVPKSKAQPTNYDLASLIKPNKVIKNNFMKAAETLGKKMQNPLENNQNIKAKIHTKPQINEQNTKELPDLLMPGSLTSNKINPLKGKKLIQEIDTK